MKEAVKVGLVLVYFFLGVILIVLGLYNDKNSNYKSFPMNKGCCHGADCIFPSGTYGEGWCYAYWPDGTIYQSSFYKNGEVVSGKGAEYNEKGVKVDYSRGGE